ncbi:hypothetical protein PPRY_b1029 [Pseudoalteromonas prydzensis ACAM 620]|nr:hypothetical protein [Pseudoalteromonas prydzensis ACAM 620]
MTGVKPLKCKNASSIYGYFFIKQKGEFIVMSINNNDLLLM